MHINMNCGIYLIFSMVALLGLYLLHHTVLLNKKQLQSNFQTVLIFLYSLLQMWTAGHLRREKSKLASSQSPVSWNSKMDLNTFYGKRMPSSPSFTVVVNAVFKWKWHSCDYLSWGKFATTLQILRGNLKGSEATNQKKIYI